MDVVKVEKLVLNIHGKKLELSIEDARKLHEALGETLGVNKRYCGCPSYYPWGWPYDWSRTWPQITWSDTVSVPSVWTTGTDDSNSWTTTSSSNSGTQWVNIDNEITI